MSAEPPGDQARNKATSPSIAARLLARLNRFFRKPSKPQYFEVEAYQNWLEKNGEDLYEHFYSKHTSFEGKCILDLACGYGGKAAVYGRQSPEFICGIDLNTGVIREAQGHLKELQISAEFSGAEAGLLPFLDSTFDLVISDDGFDHFKQPARVLDEIARVLKAGGIALISFVPYYSSGCSHMTEYLRVPWHHVAFSRKALRQALDLVAAESEVMPSGTSSQRSDVSGVFSTFENQLSRLTIRQFRKALTGISGMRLVRLRKQSRDSARPLTYLPGADELFTNALYCVLVKEESQRVRGLDFGHQILLDFAQDARALARRAGLLAASDASKRLAAERTDHP